MEKWEISIFLSRDTMGLKIDLEHRAMVAPNRAMGWTMVAPNHATVLRLYRDCRAIGGVTGDVDRGISRD